MVSLTWKVDDKYKDNVVAGRSKRRMLEETRIWGDSLKFFELTDSELEDNNTIKYLKFKALINNTHFFFNPFTSSLFQFVFFFF